jgi:8-oxo-dGTP pyrophosphatase MutT (NUDIX family)
MNLLKTIKLREFAQTEIDSAFFRQAARAVVIDQDGKIGLLYSRRKKVYKLPGGGLKKDESLIQACHRECLEELGCKIEIIKELGEIIELKEGRKGREKVFYQESYHYLAKVAGEKKEPNFTTEEIKNGFTAVWVSLAEAINLIKAVKPKNHYIFIQERELTVLAEVKKYWI